MKNLIEKNLLSLPNEISEQVAAYAPAAEIDARILPVYRTLLQEQAKQPYSMNLLHLVHTDENAHSRILCRLLQYPGSEQTYPFALLFVERFISVALAKKIKDCEQDPSFVLKIAAEENRIDVQLFMRGVAGIIVENKIEGAVDQPRQLERYIQRMQERGIKSPYIVYLTWNGIKTISPDSLSLEKQEKMLQTGHLVKLSYQFDLIPWLKEQILPQCPYGQQQLIAALEQYIEYLEFRSGLRPQDSAINQAVYRAFCEQFITEK